MPYPSTENGENKRSRSVETDKDDSPDPLIAEAAVNVTEKSPIELSNTLVGVVPPQLAVPKSAYAPFESPFPRSREKKALESLSKIVNQEVWGPEYVNYILDEYTIYRHEPRQAQRYGMVSLNDVAVKEGTAVFYFDGILKPRPPNYGDSKVFYLQMVPFRKVSISGYEDTSQHMLEDIWIQSVYCERRGDIWYELRTPAAEYKQYHDLFCWVANLSKHLVDYLCSNPTVKLAHFQDAFAEWLLSHHGQDPRFLLWMKEYKRADFRHAVIAHAPFLQKQALNINAKHDKHPIWSELGLSAHPIVKRQPTSIRDTVVTPYVYSCFKEMGWAHHLKVMELPEVMKLRHERRLREMKFVRGKQRCHTVQFADGTKAEVGGGSSHQKISPGDVIAISRDERPTWKRNNDRLWYGLVHGIRQLRSRRERLFIIWLYRPFDTVCSNLTYPYESELFLSDHCNCKDAPIYVTDVVKTVKVTFFSHQAEADTEYFVRQTYHAEDETFTTLTKEHFRCSCGREEPVKYLPGDTVLFETVLDRLRLEPAELVKLEQGGAVTIRRLVRKAHLGYKDCRPNELVYTDRQQTINIEQIQRACHVRFYTQKEKDRGSIPAPYSRDGNGDAFYVIDREEVIDGQSLLVPCDIVPPQLKQGFDPTRNYIPKLRALNIFSGGGNFDRGLEEGGAIRNDWAVEWGLPQMLTYRANLRRPDRTNLFCGSVNDYLAKAIHGRGRPLVAQLGEPSFIAGGSPCQGFSLINSLKNGERSLRNSSMIASVAAFVDFYRPKYAVLENVPAMANRTHERNPLSQLLCAFVGMGYQVRVLNIDAWSFGTPQSRSRLFMIMAAPGLQLPELVPLTHSHPPSVNSRSLLDAPSGLSFGARRWEIPVFDYVTAAAASDYLPAIGPGRVISIPYPDHRVASYLAQNHQTIMKNIPKWPRKSGLIQALQGEWLTTDQAGSVSLRRTPKSKAWSRMHPDHLFPTITTRISPLCQYTGRCLHWSEDRIMSIHEARITQGFPDNEVIVGKPSEQWQVIGNSVARQVALALGLAIRNACLVNYRWKRGGPIAIREDQVAGVVTTADAVQVLIDRQTPPFDSSPSASVRVRDMWAVKANSTASATSASTKRGLSESSNTGNIGTDTSVLTPAKTESESEYVTPPQEANETSKRHIQDFLSVHVDVSIQSIPAKRRRVSVNVETSEELF